MTFHCTLVRGPLALHHAAPPVELAVELPDGDPGARVQAAVESEFATGPLMVGGLPLNDLKVGTSPLVPGAVLLDGAAPEMGIGGPGPDASNHRAGPAALSLLVHAGPAAGMVFPLERGTYTIGRNGTDICLPDPDLSRVHAILAISETAVTLTDNASANGTTVDERKIRSAAITTTSRFRCGSSGMSIVFGHEDPGNEWLGAAGVGVAEPLLVPRRPESFSRTQILLTAGLPLLLGVGMALATGMWMFLGFTAISAVAILAPAISGRRHRRALVAALREAVKKDKARRRRCSPSAAELAFAVRPGAARTSRGSWPHPATPSGSTMAAAKETDIHEIWLRLGTSQQDARVALDPADPHFQPPPVGRAPLVLDPSIRTVSLAGSEARVDGMIRFLLMQLAAFPSVGKVPVVVHGPLARLPSSARFLPCVTITTEASSAAAALAAAGDHPAGALFLLGTDRDAGTEALRKTADGSSWRVFQHVTGKDGGDCVLELWNKRAVLRLSSSNVEFDPDLVSHSDFDRFCRSRAAMPASSTKGAAVVPPTCGLSGLLPYDPPTIAARWKSSEGRSTLSAVIGEGARGPRAIDLVSDGPHLLVAGTTGSGKSELLRTMVTAISLTHGPDKVNFLFVDFKGGSGLGPLVGLPQCVGMLTDLSEHELERTLSSLRAEVRFREGILAEAAVPDLPAYWALSAVAAEESDAGREDRVVLPRLVLVIDEFRMLIEEAPAALAELMRIATVGRSLGIHLIMATQRPQGALSADIRANVTTSIALRVQSETESRDIINSPLAASIPVSVPGRAYVVRGTEEAETFQSATLSAVRRTSYHSGPIARTAAESLSCGTFSSETDTAGPTPAEAARPIINAINAAWSAQGGRAPRKPVAEALPESISYNACLSAASPSGRHALPERASPAGAAIGLVDMPDEQTLGPLHWSPAAHGHLGLVGLPGGGVDSTCRAIAAQIVTGADEVHAYFLDGDGSLSDVRAHGRIGAIASLSHLRRGVRVLERLTAEISARQSRAAAGGEVPLLLVISSWGAWVSHLRSGPFAWAEDCVHTIVRDGPTSGLTVLVTGDRELVTSRLFASIPNRAYFPTGTTEEGRLAWPRFSALKPVRSRAIVCGNFLSVGTAAAQLVAPGEGADWPYRQPPKPKMRPFRVEPLPRSFKASELSAETQAGTGTRTGAGAGAGTNLPSRDSSPGSARSLLLGLGGDELEPVWAPLPRQGVLPILGPPGSGKSSLLAAMQLLNPDHPWLSPSQGSDPGVFYSDLHRRASRGLLSADTIILVDDAELLSDETGAFLAEFPAMGFSVVATATQNPSLVLRCPLLSRARSHGAGILLGARSPSDGELFGIRIEVEPHPPPGRALLVEHGLARPFQVAAPE